MGVRFQKRLLSDNLSVSRQKIIKKAFCLLIIFALTKMYGYEKERVGLIGLEIGREKDQSDFVSLNTAIRIKDFYLYGKFNYFIPLNIEITEEYFNAYRTIGMEKVERYSGRGGLYYGEKIGAGLEISIDYYRIKELNIEFNETKIFLSGYYEGIWGRFYGEYSLNNEFLAGYEYTFSLNHLKYGIDASLNFENNTIFAVSGFISTFQKDFRLQLTYRQGIKYDIAYPVTICISKNYADINLELSFTPSTITGSSFYFKLSYYLDRK